MCTVYNATSRTKNQPVKIIVNGTQGTMLFSKKGVRLKINQSKLLLAVHRIKCYFSQKKQD